MAGDFRRSRRRPKTTTAPIASAAKVPGSGTVAPGTVRTPLMPYSDRRLDAFESAVNLIHVPVAHVVSPTFTSVEPRASEPVSPTSSTPAGVEPVHANVGATIRPVSSTFNGRSMPPSYKSLFESANQVSFSRKIGTPGVPGGSAAVGRVSV